MKALFAAILFFLFLAAQASAAGQGIVLYKVGEGGQEMLADLGKALGFKGYTVEIIQGETEIDKHVEKAGKITGAAAPCCLPWS